MFKPRHDIPASIAVSLVALPLCLGIALASGTPAMSGIIAGVVGGIVVGALSSSHISVSGPAAGLVAIVLGALGDLGSFEAFLVAVILAGGIQLVLGLLRAGGIAHYVPSAVIQGLLAAIGLILIVKQIPHAVGYDADAEGDFSFAQRDGENTFTELLHVLDGFELGAVVIAALCFALIAGWRRIERLKNSPVPVELLVVLLGVAVNSLFLALDSSLWLGATHRVLLPPFDGVRGFVASLVRPDWTAFGDAKVYLVATTLALVASLETLLNLDAADRLDRHRRVSSPNRELVAQGIGNILSGALGGLPITSVVVRSSVNAYSGAESRASAIMHGIWLLAAVLLVPQLINLIPLSALAVILIVIGAKLASPSVFREIWRSGWSQFLPFIATVTAIVFTDLLVGVLIGLAIGIASVVRNLIATPFLAWTKARPAIGYPARIKLAQHITFLHRAKLIKTFQTIPPDSDLVLDASKVEHIDSDAIAVIRDFRDVQSKERNIRVSFVGFDDAHDLGDEVHYVDVFTRERQENLRAGDALELMRRGNNRFASGKPLERDLQRQVRLTADTQHPFAAVLACIDSRVPTELLFDTGLGDIFSVRVAGNVLSTEVVASLEFAVKIAGVRLILVLGHTGCGAIKAACQGVRLGHITELLARIQPAVDRTRQLQPNLDPNARDFHSAVSRSNVEYVRDQLCDESPTLSEMLTSGELVVVGALYDIETGLVDFMESP